MKVITKTVEITVYVSDDGKEFRNKENCLYHEKKEKVLRRYKWKTKVMEDLEKFFDSCDSHNCDSFPLRDNIMLINNLLFYQNVKERRTTIVNIKTGRIGKAICNKNDYFSRMMGWAIAWTRYNGNEIPDYI